MAESIAKSIGPKSTVVSSAVTEPITQVQSNTQFYGETGAKLIKESIRTRHLPLSAYRDDLVRDICLEMKYLYTSLNDIQLKSVDDTTKITNLLHSISLQRNKRCVLAYLAHRVHQMIYSLWNTGGGASTATALAPEFKKALSPFELTFTQEYRALASDYRGHFLDIDLDIFAEIRVLQDCGDLMTESGTISLIAGTQHYLRRADVEDLILQGVVQHLS